MITKDPMVVADEPADEELKQSTVTALPPSASKVNIKPLHNDKEALGEPKEASADKAADSTETPQPATDVAASDESKTGEAAETTMADDDRAETADDTETTNPGETEYKPAADEAAATKAETAAKQREAEMMELIASHQFFVPVEPAERQKADRTSLWLTLLVLVLAVILIDLMLDANVVLLVEKIPHTHFFSH